MNGGLVWFGLPGPCGNRSFFFWNASMYLTGPKATSWTSLVAWTTKLTVVPAFTRSTSGLKSRIVVFPPRPMYTVFGGTFVFASVFAFAHAASVSTFCTPLTSSGVCTAAPLAFTSTTIFMPGWSWQKIAYWPTFGNAYVAVPGRLSFGEKIAPALVGTRPLTVLGP